MTPRSPAHSGKKRKLLGRKQTVKASDLSPELGIALGIDIESDNDIRLPIPTLFQFDGNINGSAYNYNEPFITPIKILLLGASDSGN